MIEFDWSRIPNRNTGYEFEDSFLVNTNRVHDAVYVNATARLVWGLCDGETTIGRIASDLEEAYPGSEEAVREDVRKAIERLVDYGVVYFSGPP